MGTFPILLHLIEQNHRSVPIKLYQLQDKRYTNLPKRTLLLFPYHYQGCHHRSAFRHFSAARSTRMREFHRLFPSLSKPGDEILISESSSKQINNRSLDLYRSQLSTKPGIRSAELPLTNQLFQLPAMLSFHLN